MADALENTDIPANTMVNLYAANPSIPLGERIAVNNVGGCQVYLFTQEVEPDVDQTNYQLLPQGGWLANDRGDSGAWAFCAAADGEVNVRVAQ